MQFSRRIDDAEVVIEEEGEKEEGKGEEEKGGEEEGERGTDRRLPKSCPGISISSTLLVCTRFSDTQRHTHNSVY